MGTVSTRSSQLSKMRVLVLFLLVAVSASASAQADIPMPPMYANQPVPYGIIDTVKDVVEGMIESGVKIGEKIGDMLKQVKGVMDELKKWYDEIVSQGNTIESVLKTLHEKMVDQIENVMHIIFDQVAAVFLSVAEYVNSTVTGYPFEAMIKQAMHSVMTGIFDKYIEVMTDALSTFLKTIDFVNTPDWDAFVNEIIDEVQADLDTKLDDFSKDLRKALQIR